MRQARRAATPDLVRPPSFPRTARALASDRSFRVVLVALLGAAALGAWTLWAAWGDVELIRPRGRPGDAWHGGRGDDRPERSPSP